MVPSELLKGGGWRRVIPITILPLAFPLSGADTFPLSRQGKGGSPDSRVGFNSGCYGKERLRFEVADKEFFDTGLVVVIVEVRVDSPRRMAEVLESTHHGVL